MSTAYRRRINNDLLRPLLQTAPGFYVVVGLLSLIVAAGFGSWAY